MIGYPSAASMGHVDIGACVHLLSRRLVQYSPFTRLLIDNGAGVHVRPSPLPTTCTHDLYISDPSLRSPMGAHGEPTLF